MKNLFHLLAIATLVSCVTSAGTDHPQELGKVSWLTDHEAALALAKTSGKPVFLLFQEVPG